MGWEFPIFDHDSWQRLTAPVIRCLLLRTLFLKLFELFAGGVSESDGVCGFFVEDFKGEVIAAAYWERVFDFSCLFVEYLSIGFLIGFSRYFDARKVSGSFASVLIFRGNRMRPAEVLASVFLGHPILVGAPIF